MSALADLYNDVRLAGARIDLFFAGMWSVFVLTNLAAKDWTEACLSLVIAACYMRIVAMQVVADMTKRYGLTP